VHTGFGGSDATEGVVLCVHATNSGSALHSAARE